MKCTYRGDCPSKKEGQCTANPPGYCIHQQEEKKKENKPNALHL